MALISCPECGSSVSDQASACPQCGFPIRAEVDSGPEPPVAGDPDPAIRDVLLKRGKIAAIKRCRELKPGFGLKDAKEHVERLEAQLPPGQRVAPKGAGCLALIALAAAGAVGLWVGV